MPVVRRFLIAPALARLIRRSVGASRLAEAHMPTGPARHVHIHIAEDAAHLVLTTADGTSERCPLPTAQAEALAEAAAGHVAYDRSEVALDGAVLRIDSFTVPGPLDIAEASFADDAGACAFAAPVWLGPEITHEPHCDTRSIALHSLSLAAEMPITDAIIDAVLDMLDQQELRALLGRARSAEAPAPTGEDQDRMDAAVAA
jgi:CYTH domain-containing protein